MKITTTEINSKIEKSEQEFIDTGENGIMTSINYAAKKIVDGGRDKPFILISGPSGSGKTTSAIKLYKAISALGENVCYISMDKYFKNFNENEKELKRQGKIDLEAPERVDTDFLNAELTKLLDGDKINIPIYDFATNSRTITDKQLDRKGGYVIVEGIHALNPSVLGNIDEMSTKIYVSVRSRILDSDGDKLHPCKIRLMRRMMRDKLYRGREIDDTVNMFPKVQRGENMYIMPYKSRSDIDIDTFIPYEASLYKGYLYKEMQELFMKRADIRDVVKSLEELKTIGADLIPGDAMVREFIGGSSLKY